MKPLIQLQPFESKNLIFIDTEFSDLDPYKGELLSVGIVKLDGKELYIELEHDPDSVSDWAKKHILPMLDGAKMTREQTAASIKRFLGASSPYAVAFVDNYDVIYLTKLFGHGKLPFKWMTIDMASVLFALGISPVRFGASTTSAKEFYKTLGLDSAQYRQHHALDDAKLLCEAWLKLTNHTPTEGETA